MQAVPSKSLSRAKMLGGIGSILTLLLFVPFYVGAALVIIGWILIVIAVKDISDTVQDGSIFTNAIISVVMAIIGVAVFAIVVASAFLSLIGLGSMSSTTPPPTSDLITLITGILAGLAIVWIVGVIGSFFLWRSFKAIGTRLSVGLFGTGALIYFIGSILTIVVVGFFLLFIAEILFIVAFFSIPDNPPQPGMMQPQPMRPA